MLTTSSDASAIAILQTSQNQNEPIFIAKGRRMVALFRVTLAQDLEEDDAGGDGDV